MPTLEANLDILSKNLGLNNNEIENLLFDYGLEVENIDTNENKIEIDIPPSRLELFSTYSLLENLNIFLLKKEASFPEIKESDIKVVIDAKNSRKSVSFIIKNVNLNEDKLKELINFQEKIHTSLFRKRKKAAIGVYDLDKIESKTIYFKAGKIENIEFQPLNEEFLVRGKELIEKTEKGREFSSLLENYEKEGYWPVFYDEQGNVLSVPPIINSNKAGNVSTSTKNIWVEISGDDLDYLKKHASLIMKVVKDIVGGEIFNVNVFEENKKIADTYELVKKEELNVEDVLKEVNYYLSNKLDENILINSLKKMAYIYEKDKLFKPWYRSDIYSEQDILEDIIIANNFNKMENVKPKLFTIGSLNKMTEISEKFRELLIGLGFLEQIGEILTNTKKLEKLGLKIPEVTINNSSDENINTLRTSTLVSFIDFLKVNTLHSYPQKVFDIGIVINDKFEEDLEKNEKTNLGIIWSENKVNFNNAKQIVEYLLDRTIGKIYEFSEIENSYYLLEGRRAYILVNGKKIGEFGEINPEILFKEEIFMPTIFIEIYLDEIKNYFK